MPRSKTSEKRIVEQKRLEKQLLSSYAHYEILTNFAEEYGDIVVEYYFKDKEFFSKFVNGQLNDSVNDSINNLSERSTFINKKMRQYLDLCFKGLIYDLEYLNDRPFIKMTTGGIDAVESIYPTDIQLKGQIDLLKNSRAQLDVLFDFKDGKFTNIQNTLSSVTNVVNKAEALKGKWLGAYKEQFTAEMARRMRVNMLAQRAIKLAKSFPKPC